MVQAALCINFNRDGERGGTVHLDTAPAPTCTVVPSVLRPSRLPGDPCLERIGVSRAGALLVVARVVPYTCFPLNLADGQRDGREVRAPGNAVRIVDCFREGASIPGIPGDRRSCWLPAGSICGLVIAVKASRAVGRRVVILPTVARRILRHVAVIVPNRGARRQLVALFAW